MSDLPIRLPRLEVQQQEETPTNSPPHNHKTRSLRDLYEKTLIIDEKHQYALFSCHPSSFNEAINNAQWVNAMNEQIDSIEKNQTWDLVDIPADKTNTGVKWVYKTKVGENEELEKHKARLFAK